MSIIFFDLDGTLAPVGLPVPEKVAEGLRELERRGHRVALCSGKPAYYLCGLLRQLGLKQPAIAGENGAAIQLGVDLPPAVRGALPYPESTRRALEELRRELERSFGGQVWFQPNEHMLTCFPHTEALFEPIEEIIAKSHPEQAGLVVYRHCDCFDIIPEGVDKGAGVRELCRLLGEEPERCTAVGDHTNDLPMFRAVGRAIAVGGFAPAEAHLRFDTIAQAMKYLLGE